jgi:hypothetical protein
MRSTVEIGGLLNKDRTREGFVTSNLAATARIECGS